MRKNRMELIVTNPKRKRKSPHGVGQLYPFYPSFSEVFVEKLIRSANLNSSALLVDPWNGSGTTTKVASELGVQATGIDLNPIMAISARAGLLSPNDLPSLKLLGRDIRLKAKRYKNGLDSPDDPLRRWLTPFGAANIRRVEKAIYSLLVESEGYHPHRMKLDVCSISSIAAFFYVVLFGSVRLSIKGLRTTNPTWIKTPKTARHRLRPKLDSILRDFDLLVNASVDAACLNQPVVNEAREKIARIEVGSSTDLPMTNSSTDFVVTSPPYCTRIDYAVATSIELAILGYDETCFDGLRRELIGTTTVAAEPVAAKKAWGDTCNQFLAAVSNHDSKASRGYYLKSHLSYYDSLFESIAEIARILRKDAVACLVVQDSYYKDVHNDLPRIVEEMGASVNLGTLLRKDFSVKKTIAGTNPRSRPYRKDFSAVEAVVCLQKVV